MTQPPNEQDIFARVVLGMSAPKRMAEAMVSTPPSASVSRRWGTIDAINTGNNTVSVNIGGIIVPGVRRVATYAPTVGETVMLDVVNGDMVVVNTLLPSPKNDLGSLSTTVSDNSSTIANHETRLDAAEDPPLMILRGSNTSGATVSIPNGVWTDIDLAVNETSAGTIGYSTTNARAKILMAGYYMIQASSGPQTGSAAGRKGVRFTKFTGGTTQVTSNNAWEVYLQLPASTPSIRIPGISYPVAMAVNDEVGLAVYQDSGAAMNFRLDLTYLTVTYFRPL